MPDIRLPQIRADILLDVLAERSRQDNKWGIQKHDHLKWLAILMEEVGEVSECVNELTPVLRQKRTVKTYQKLLKHELIQVIAVVMAWLECMENEAKG